MYVPPKPGKKKTAITFARGIAPKAALARAQAARELQAYQFGAYDTVESTRSFHAGKAKTARWLKAGRGRLVQNADGDRADDQFGVAPLVAGAAVSAVTGGRVLGVSFKKPSPRVFGGPLVSTVNDYQARVERGDLSAVQGMDTARKTAKDKSAWQRIWNEMLPTWKYPANVYDLIKRLDPSFPGGPPPAATAGPMPMLPPPSPTVTPVAPPPVLYQPPPPPSYFPSAPAPLPQEQPSYQPTETAASYTPPGQPVPGETPSGESKPGLDVKKLIVPALIAASLLL